MAEVLISLFVILYNLTLVAGTAYLIALHGWSAWWFLAAAFFIMSYKKGDKNE